jgi:hypothetical protein
MSEGPLKVVEFFNEVYVNILEALRLHVRLEALHLHGPAGLPDVHQWQFRKLMQKGLSSRSPITLRRA